MVLFFLQVFFMKPRLGKNGSPPPKLGFDKLLLATFVLAKTTTNEFPYFFLPLIPLLPRAKKGNGGSNCRHLPKSRVLLSLLSVFGHLGIRQSGFWSFFCALFFPCVPYGICARKRLSRGAKKVSAVRQKPNIVCSSLRGKKYSTPTLFRSAMGIFWASQVMTWGL